MPWLWIAAVSADDNATYDGAVAQAQFSDVHGEAAGRLVAWPHGSRPHPDARRADAAFVDAAGAATTLAMQWLERDREPLFDDPAVQGLLRAFAAHTEPGAGALTTLVRDSVHFCGALVSDIGRPQELQALGPVALVAVDAGFVSSRRQVLSGTQRSGGAPWPADG